jgi:hypothetical protein
MGNTNKANRKLEISLDALEDSRGGFVPVISIGDVKLNLKANMYETAEQAVDKGNKNFAAMLEITLRAAMGNNYYL